jgi:hypothetical protein
MGSPRPVRNYLIPIDVGEASMIELNVPGVKHSEVLAILAPSLRSSWSLDR